MLRPGRDARPTCKTDVKDATGLADLLAHGLLRPSFVPAMPEQALRDLTRARKQLTREKASHVQRIDKTLQAATIKLGSVLSNIMGQSGRVLLEALAAGERDPERLAGLVRTKIRASHAQVVEAVRGRLAAHQRLLLQLYLAPVDALDAAIAAIDHEVGERLEPVQETVRRLITMPGLSPLSAAVVISEMGLDMSRFPSAAPLISWAGLGPKNDESAGKRRSHRLRPGAPWLKAVLVQSAWCAVRVKASYLHALFQRLKARRGPRNAIVAVAAAMLTAIYHMLKRGAAYRDLGPDHVQRTERSRLAARLARKLGELGFDVTLTQRAAA
jgi:transposase